MLQCVKNGRNPTMRHIARTHRISVAFLHDVYRAREILFAHEDGTRMPPDIFTKMFQDAAKWRTARLLVCIVLPSELAEIIKQSADIYKGIQDKPAMIAIQPSRHSTYRSDNYGSASTQQQNHHLQHQPPQDNNKNEEGSTKTGGDAHGTCAKHAPTVSDDTPAPGGGTTSSTSIQPTCTTAENAQSRQKKQGYRSWSRIDISAQSYQLIPKKAFNAPKMGDVTKRTTIDLESGHIITVDELKTLQEKRNDTAWLSRALPGAPRNIQTIFYSYGDVPPKGDFIFGHLFVTCNPRVEAARERTESLHRVSEYPSRSPSNNDVLRLTGARSLSDFSGMSTRSCIRCGRVSPLESVVLMPLLV